MIKKIEPQKIEQIKEKIEQIESKTKVAIVVHVSPDGDAVGSALGMYHLIKILRKVEAKIIFPSRYPDSFNFLPGIKEQIIAKESPDQAKQIISEADLLFCLDFNEAHRAAEMAKSIHESKAYIVHIDHHIHPENFADLVFSYPEASSTCLLIYKILDEADMISSLTLEALECLYLGMMTDTGGFSYNSNDPYIYTVISEMLKRGLDKDKISAQINRNYSIYKIKLNAHILTNNMYIDLEKKTAICTLSLEEKKRFNYQIGDTEGLVNMPLEAKDILLSIFIYQQKDYVKLSFRSKDPFACNTLASKYFNGGGHRNASGAEFHGTLEEAFQAVLSAICQQHP